jgi:phosphatidylserine/phosphatidylglycerophosphate/cardiolipin synthase-like enzyme
MNIFLHLSRPALVNLATALENGRISPPFLASNIANYIPTVFNQAVVDELNCLNDKGVHSQHIAYTLRMLAEERAASQVRTDAIDLVWTGPEVSGSQSRNTSVVVHELFSNAKRNILISSFAVDTRRKTRELFMVLAKAMDSNPELNVRIFLNVHRPYNNEVTTTTLLREVFHDPRSLRMDKKACLHAKCLIVDQERVLVTSANFTEAAHDRNIEAGLLLNDPVIAQALQMQFESLVSRNILCPIPGI